MSNGDSIKSAIEAMNAEKARRLAEAAAEIDRDMAADMAELERLSVLAAKYNLRVVSADAGGHITTDLAALTGSTTISHNGMTVKLISDKSCVQTLAELATIYRSDERSPYRALRFKVRDGYDSIINRILDECGHMCLTELNADGIQHLYDRWSDGGTKLATGHTMMTRLRGLFSFGTTTLDDPGCQRLSTIMSKMRFQNPVARTEQLTPFLVSSIRAKAHEMGKPSIALAQAIQYELMLAQKDTIGEWVPASEPGESDIVVDGTKWLHGIRWSQIDDNLILRHVTSFRQKSVEIDLKRAPMVMAELEMQFGGVLPKTGPIIRSEWNERPWSSAEFRRWWRKIADAAGVPKNIKNMDSRPVEHRSVTTRNSLNAIQRREGVVH
ncbi:hypothetical protein [Bradyrhizobium sp. OAE829]|uniref:hypothetical protein n=1 Tax=Bradyrhizobium sp. OAE829 TaxID=2663807 RepID=UPI00178B87F6